MLFFVAAIFICSVNCIKATFNVSNRLSVLLNYVRIKHYIAIVVRLFFRFSCIRLWLLLIL